MGKAKPFWTFDCETDPFKFGRIPKPFLWGAFNGKDYIEFKSTEDFAEFLKAEDAYFYAHNGGKFDVHFLAPWLERNKKLILIHGRLVKAKIGKAEVRDSYALLPFALKTYKKDDIDYSKLEQGVRESHMPEISAYLKADCVYLWELIDAFFKEYGRNLTAPSAAIKTLQKIENIKIDNSGRYFFEEFKPFYTGGRTQVFNSGSFYEPITCLDINSAYPFAMLHPHPFNFDFKKTYYKDPIILPWNFYHIKAKSWGSLPFRTKKGLTFPDDGQEREFFATGWEVKAGLETGTLYITEHLEQKVFYEQRNYSKFVNHFWTQRQTTKKGTPENLFAKLMLNSAYGKTAANPLNYDTFVLYDPAITAFLIERGWEIRGHIGKHLLASTPLDPSDMRFYNVATGASITGFVRAMLWRKIRESGEVLYCDTDSIFCKGIVNEDSKELGQFKTEGVFTESHFAGKKLYACKNNQEEKISSKGSRLTFNEVKRIAEGETILWCKDAPVFSWKKQSTFLTRKIEKTT